VVNGDLAIAAGTTRTFKSERRDDLERAYYNLFVMKFEDGRCREFTEWFMETPAGKAPIT
jgi:hypothetical protein